MNNSNKIPVYCVPGLAANSKIFEFISLPKDTFEMYYLEWLIPLHIEETLSDYALRMCALIQHENPILIGVSFGGILVQEMSKLIKTQKVIIISSIKNNQEFPKQLKLIKSTGAYKLFPTKIVAHIEDYEKYFLGGFLKKRAEMYKIYLSVRDPLYLHWSIYNVLHWNQKESLPNIIHIHGTNDHVFPLKYINNAIEIEKGTHAMILIKAKNISKIIQEALTC
ncbi:alpha/beta hydrolase family protein [Tenacibaculum maritimum]|uniref:Alpha/beta hydrolase n=1 Tax=Tenacibaculum maritimum NCIMB 2154 TaxID=1349785 RepID=A0A2H1EBG0_9FLAO|nr:alpha/beta hydrolase [Tenacibaculum maritimum]SFZ83766.1 conserved protein of unknown function [Tenacibaculum maritimum NCIMB 2154]